MEGKGKNYSGGNKNESDLLRQPLGSGKKKKKIQYFSVTNCPSPSLLLNCQRMHGSNSMHRAPEPVCSRETLAAAAQVAGLDYHPLNI